MRVGSERVVTRCSALLPRCVVVPAQSEAVEVAREELEQEPRPEQPQHVGRAERREPACRGRARRGLGTGAGDGGGEWRGLRGVCGGRCCYCGGGDGGGGGGGGGDRLFGGGGGGEGGGGEGGGGGGGPLRLKVVVGHDGPRQVERRVEDVGQVHSQAVPRGGGGRGGGRGGSRGGGGLRGRRRRRALLVAVAVKGVAQHA